MTTEEASIKRWYLSLIAGFFLVLCGISSVRYLAMDFSLIDGYVAISAQILCFAVTMAAALYFFRPMAGCLSLVGVSLCALVLSFREGDGEAAMFFIMVISLFLVPVLAKPSSPSPVASTLIPHV